jgi:hypothetical protein
MSKQTGELSSLQKSESYDAMLSVLDTSIREITEKIESGRIRDPENEKVRIKWHRALGYMVRTKREVVKDATLEELAERIDQLEEQEGLQ